jgi:hypothetical protein
MHNYQNTLIEQGSSWFFAFTLSKAYPKDHTIRFIFPENFKTLKVQCNITGVLDQALQTRVFPQQNIYDCLNVDGILQVNQRIILSGIVNPDYEMVVPGAIVMILQPNNIVPIEKITVNPSSTLTIRRKNMNATVVVPNLYRNNTLTYIYEINMDSSL